MSRYCDDEDCSVCNELQDEIDELQNKIEDLQGQIELLKQTNGLGYEYGPSTATLIYDMDHLRRWVADHNKAHGQ